MADHPLRIMIVDDDVDFVQQVKDVMHKTHPIESVVVWRRTGRDAVREVQRHPDVDLIITEYFLPDQSGLKFVKKLRSLKIHSPVVFYTVNKDFDIVVEILKLGVQEYLVKNEFAVTSLPQVIANILEKEHQHTHSMAEEITRQRLTVMKDLIAKILREIETPAHEMKKILDRWNSEAKGKEYEKFVKIIDDNITRILTKIGLLRSLKSDKTVTYIKDIRMIDLS